MVLSPYLDCGGFLFGSYFIKSWVPISKFYARKCVMHLRTSRDVGTLQNVKIVALSCLAFTFPGGIAAIILHHILMECFLHCLFVAFSCVDTVISMGATVF